MKPKKAVKELEKQLRKDPDNLVVRLRLAAALREVGRTNDAVLLYRGVAVEYHAQARLAQAIAVCKSVLEIEPGQRETQILLAELEAMTGAGHGGASRPGGEASRPAGGGPSFRVTEVPARRASAPVPAGEPDVGGGPDTSDALELPSLARVARSRADSGPHAPGSSSSKAAHPRAPATPARLPPPADHQSSRELPPAARSRPPPKPKSDPSLMQSRPPGVPGPRRSGPMLRQDEGALTQPSPKLEMPTGRTSSLVITPTPLPPPLPFHDGDDHEEAAALGAVGSPAGDSSTGGAASRPPAPPVELDVELDVVLESELAEAVADEDVVEDADEDAQTHVADELGWRPPVARAAASRARPPSPRGPPPPPPPRPRDPFDEATRLGDSLGSVDPHLVQATAPDVAWPSPVRASRPTCPSAVDDHDTVKSPRLTAPFGSADSRLGSESGGGDQGDGRITDRLLRGYGHSVDVEDPRDTDIHDRVALESVGDWDVTREGDDTHRKQRPTAPDLPTDDDEPLALDRSFRRSYSETLDRLAPDGSAIDEPLSLLSDLPDEVAVELMRRMSLRSYGAGEVVIREGDPGDACFVIVSGGVRVLKRDPADERAGLIEVARLGAGALFGEFALLADRRRHATVQTVEPSDVYEIPRRLWRELAVNHPEVGPALERFYRERLLATLLSTAPLFSPLAEDRRSELLARFEPLRVDAGEPVVVEGESAGGLFLIVLGSVEIRKLVATHQSVLLATLGEGSYFGEMSLMRGGLARATVTAKGPTELAKLPAQEFYEVVADNPVLWEEIRREAHRRELMMSQILTGDTSIV